MTPPIGSVRAGVRGMPLGSIPDSVVMQYFATTWSQGEATWQDDAGTVDMAFTGDFQSGTLSDGSQSVDGDGTDDHGAITLPSNFEGSSLNEFSIELAVEHTQSGTRYIAFGLLHDTNNQRLQLFLNEDESFSNEDGQMMLDMQDQNGNDLRAAPSTNPNIDDGDRHDISIIVDDAANNQLSMIIDGSSVSLSYGAQNSPSTFGTWTRDMVVWARQQADGNILNYWNGKIGAMRWHDSAISEQTIDDYP